MCQKCARILQTLHSLTFVRFEISSVDIRGPMCTIIHWMDSGIGWPCTMSINMLVVVTRRAVHLSNLGHTSIMKSDLRVLATLAF